MVFFRNSLRLLVHSMLVNLFVAGSLFGLLLKSPQSTVFVHLSRNSSCVLERTVFNSMFELIFSHLFHSYSF